MWAPALATTLTIKLVTHEGFAITNLRFGSWRPYLKTALGIPPQAMADPADVGRKLAKKIFSTQPVITPDFRTAAYLFFARRFPDALGRLLSRMAAKGRES